MTTQTRDVHQRPRATGAEAARSCPRCGAAMEERKCKIICENCGAYADCSDP
jgi:hypothetical protein